MLIFKTINYFWLQDSTGKIIEDAKGQVEIKVNQFHFFLVADYLGDPSVSYLCLNSNKAWMFHTGNLFS